MTRWVATFTDLGNGFAEADGPLPQEVIDDANRMIVHAENDALPAAVAVRSAFVAELEPDAEDEASVALSVLLEVESEHQPPVMRRPPYEAMKALVHIAASTSDGLCLMGEWRMDGEFWERAEEHLLGGPPAL